jgi:hypothetical protein
VAVCSIITCSNIPWLVNRVGETVAGMPSSSAMASRNGIEHSEHNIKDDEYTRLVPPAQHATADINAEVLPQQPKSRHFIWWMKVLLGCFLLMIVSYIFVKYGVPFAFEKVSTCTFLCKNSSFHGGNC